MQRLLRLAKAVCSTAQPKTNYLYKFKYGTSLLPHPEKAHKGGEDALYAEENVLLVADGVGGWIQSGVDPALYSKRLAVLVQELVKKDRLNYIDNPKKLIKDAVELNKEVGSTTVCLLTLHPNTGVMKAYYLGDSVYAIIDPTSESYRIAPDQQYSFNFPVQVGTNGADPEHGVYHQYKADEVKAEQYIVVGTDGIWDNLRDFMIYQIIAGKKQTLQQKANIITTAANHYGKSGNYQSPFYLKAKQQRIDFPKQGKLDDTAVIVARIVRETL